jgi:primosomal protein N' (replication factor Y)
MALQRMDRDSTRKKYAHHRIVKKMEGKKIDILLGTQMVAKGHDFPDVTLAAVVSADVALNLPDFRSAEKSFQLFTQLAGRAGRGDVPGRAVIQTYESDHYVFDYVRNHDYSGFYEREIKLRKELSYPPFSKIVRIVLSFRHKESAEKIMKTISDRIRKTRLAHVELLGPSPAPIEKVKGLWRWHLMIKGKRAKTIREASHKIISFIKDIKEARIDIDVDPVNLM